MYETDATVRLQKRTQNHLAMNQMGSEVAHAETASHEF